MATVFLGIYYNLTIWYKLTNRNMTGAWITLAGAVITIRLNIWWIPHSATPALLGHVLLLFVYDGGFLPAGPEILPGSL